MKKRHSSVIFYQDFNKVCRFCLKNTAELKPIFNITGEKDITQTDKAIRECLNLLVYLGDGLPEQICDTCYNKLLEYHEFWKLCHSATDTLLNEIRQNERTFMDVKVECDAEQNNMGDNHTNELYNISYLKTEDGSNNTTESNADVSLIISNSASPKIVPINRTQKSKTKKSDLEICPICGIKLRCLTQHMKTHFQEENLKICDICGFSTVQKSNLHRHMHVTHVKEGEYICKVCKAVFTDLRQLNRHKKIKHQERKYPCIHCKAIFHTSFGLTKHQTIHSGEKKHVCEECGKSYRMLDSLKAHRKRHLDPTIPCTYCTKLFYTKNELMSHVGLHTGVKGFKCDLCTAAFVASSSLAAHRRKHKKENLLPMCKLCGAQFNDRVLLRMHLNDHKKDSPFE